MRKFKMPALVILLIGVGMIGYTNCSNVKFDADNNSPVTVTGIQTVQEEIINCANAAKNGKLVVVEKTLTFESPKVETGRSVVCEYGKNDNLDQDENVLTARYEQSATVQLPGNSVLCSAAMKSNSSTFTYDDMFYLTFNDYILASSLKKSLGGLQSDSFAVGSTTERAYKYSWLGVRSTNFDQVNENSDNYCFGRASGAGDCQWPNSEKSGPFSLQFDQSLVVAVGLKAAGGTQQFKFITTGDNNPELDCTHDRLDLNVTYSYYLK
ncbi:MAG: hypothetical protein EOP06_07540 [Proteobacteria bacterium]|nr:MAG: hypothetical protein EOP06_07540 [Pseudomonadota bacterium]